MTREVVPRDDGKTIDLPIAEANSYDVNSKTMRSVSNSDVLIQMLSYTSSGLPEYIGLAIPGTATSSASWQIKKLTYSGNNVISILFADGDTKFDNIWDDKGDLDYS